MMAARGGYDDLVKLYMAKAAEGEGEGEGGSVVENFVNARTFDGTTALMVACKEGRGSVVRILLQHPNIDVEAKDCYYNTALCHALCGGPLCDGIAEMLQAHGASVKPDALAKSSALVDACARGMKGVVRLIQDRGGAEADVDFPGHNGSTALMRACLRNDVEIAEMLLQGGAAVDVVDARGWTALMYAAGCESGAEIMGLLLERGADPNLHGPQTSPPLTMACSRTAPEFGAVCQALIRAGADVNAQNSSGETALQVAIDNNNNNEAVKALLNSGAKVHADNVQRQLVQHIYDLKRDLESLIQVFPHAQASASSRER
jgi:ankyrin repeat protein